MILWSWAERPNHATPDLQTAHYKHMEKRVEAGEMVYT
jgi:hypothetical protein